MFRFAQQVVVAMLATAILTNVLPRPATAGQTLERGASSSRAAATAGLPGAAQGAGEQLAGAPLRLAYPIAASAAMAAADTTGFVFPDEEKSHLVRDITVFVIVSAFVAVFIVKVFIEEDKPEEDTGTGGGKNI